MEAEKFVSPVELPTPLETELGIILMEECAEVAQAMSKCLRFGFEEQGPGFELTNLQRLSVEWGNLIAQMGAFEQKVLLDSVCIRDGYNQKKQKPNKYLQRGDI